MAEAEEQIRRYRFGDFIVDERRGALQRNGEDVPLRPKSWGVLRQLLLHRGELVTKQALLDAVWRDRVVSEGVVAKSVREIRQALGDESRVVVRTVPGRGFLFDAPVMVETTAGPDRDGAGGALAAPETDRPTDSTPASPLAASPLMPQVLPKSARALRLAHGWWQGVLGVTLLAVVAVVWSVVLRDVDSAPRGANGSPLSNTRALPSQVVSQMSEQQRVDPANQGERRPVDQVAYQRYLEARFLFNRRFDGDLARAEQLYLEATRIDPQFGRAWAGLAGVYWVRTDLHLDESIRLSIPEAVEAMRLPIERALQADPDLAEAHIRAKTYYEMSGDVARARDHAARALALAPDDPLVLAYAGRGNDEAMTSAAQVSLFRKTIAADPLSLLPRHNLIDWLIRERRLEEARREIEAALSLFPEATGSLAYFAALIELFEGNYEAAAETARALPAEADQQHEGITLLVMALKAQGLAELAAEARLSLESDSGEWAALRVAEIHAFTGSDDKSFAWLREVSRRVTGDLLYRQRFWHHVEMSPFLVELKDDPRWRRLCEEYEVLTENQRQVG